MPANIQVDADDIPYVDASDIVWECENCPCTGETVECASNPDAPLPTTLTLSVDFCGNLSSGSSVYSAFTGDWVFAEVTEDEFVVAQSANYRLTCSAFRIQCCATEGIFWMSGTFAFYELGLDGVTWILKALASPAVNWNDSATTKCFTGTPQYDPHASLTINNTNPFNATFTFYPHYDIQGSGYTTEWAAFTAAIGCSDDEQPINIEIS